MNILIYNFNEPYPKQGGMERVTDTLASQLKSAGYNVRLMACVSNRLGEKYIPPVPLSFIPDHSNKQKARIFIQDYVQNNGIDCIIDQTEGGVVGKYGFFKNKEQLGSVKLVAVMHSSAKAQISRMPFFIKCPSSNPLLRFIHKKLYLPLRQKRATILRKYLYSQMAVNYDRIVALSPSIVREFLEYYDRIEKFRLLSIPNPNTFDIKQDCLFRKENIVLFVGRLENMSKGVDRLLRIWSSVYSKHKDWKLLIVGDGADRQVLEQQALELRLENYSFEGFQNPKPYYEKAKIFCMTSNYEGFGMVLTEAMQFGTVPIAFNSYSAVYDIIDDQTDGVIIPAFDESLYASELSVLMQNTEKLKKLSDTARKSVNKFSKENITNMWINLLSEL